MQMFFEGLIYFLVVGSLLYLIETRNIFGMGNKRETKKEALYISFLSSLFATIVYLFLVSLF
ncbi:MAG: hypothetical protein ACOC1S_02725 [bacterium]